MEPLVGIALWVLMGDTLNLIYCRSYCNEKLVTALKIETKFFCSKRLAGITPGYGQDGERNWKVMWKVHGKFN